MSSLDRGGKWNQFQYGPLSQIFTTLLLNAELILFNSIFQFKCPKCIWNGVLKHVCSSYIHLHCLSSPSLLFHFQLHVFLLLFFGLLLLLFVFFVLPPLFSLLPSHVSIPHLSPLPLLATPSSSSLKSGQFKANCFRPLASDFLLSRSLRVWANRELNFTLSTAAWISRPQGGRFKALPHATASASDPLSACDTKQYP